MSGDEGSAMSALAWWLIPIGATVLAIAWASWASRPKPHANVDDTLQSYERFRRAMGAPPSAARDPGDPSERQEGEPE
jgi:hypothetical protein